jgi:lipopolysaccharide/colanic/teichoic acid biosynthesis glycosyltransferase
MLRENRTVGDMTRTAAVARSTLRLKRAIDVVLSALLLVVLSPLLAILVVWIRLDSPGPALFRQRRLGMHRREFTILKFRTMRVGTSSDPHRSYIRETMVGTADSNGNGVFKLERAGDVTSLGRWLRRSSLDELPQLFNVLRGEMSLVGPRPCIPYELDNFAPHHFERFLTPPGLTGLWQVTSRARSTFGEALDMDVAYVRGWSLGLDLALLCRTPVQLLRSEGTA